jgi:hypothetical protein
MTYMDLALKKEINGTAKICESFQELTLVPLR